MTYYVLRKGIKLVAVFNNYDTAHAAALKLQTPPEEKTVKHIFSGSARFPKLLRTDFPNDHENKAHPYIYIEEVPAG